MNPKPDLPYAGRRARLAAQLGADAVAIIPTAPPRQRNRDSEFPYRPDSYFYYLTGFSEPEAWLVLEGSGRSTLFCQPRDPDMETWTGYRMGPEAAPVALGVDAAQSVDELDEALPRMLANTSAVWFPFATHDGLQLQVEGWLQDVRAQARAGALVPEAQRDLCVLLDEMRLIKDAHELAIMRRAGSISARGHVRAMQRSARMLRAGEDVREYHLEAELLHEFRQGGAQFPAYTSIVAAGANACVLHYPAGNARVRDGELVLIDAACELDGYASDITRTFPAGGRFSPAQRRLYELVQQAQDAAMDATRAGARFDDPHEAAVRVLTQGMLDLGLLDRKQVGDVDDAVAQRAYFPFYMHRTSHWMGMDVHDCGSYVEPSERDQVTELRDPRTDQPVHKRPSRILQPGMVLTLEPGIYVRPAEGVPEEYWNIGIRIEDDAVVTADGCELLTRGVPVAADEIEALMGA